MNRHNPKPNGGARPGSRRSGGPLKGLRKGLLLNPWDGTGDALISSTPDRHECRSAWWTSPRVPASPGPRADPPRPPANGSQKYGATCGLSRAFGSPRRVPGFSLNDTLTTEKAAGL